VSPLQRQRPPDRPQLVRQQNTGVLVGSAAERAARESDGQVTRETASGPTRPRQPQPDLARAATIRQLPPQPSARGKRQAVWEAILEAGEDARRNSHLWEQYSARLEPDLKQRLEQRRLADVRYHKVRPAAVGLNHYIQVAFEAVPRDETGAIDVADAASLGLAWLRGAGYPKSPRTTGSRVKSQMKTELEDLNESLRLLRPRVELYAIQCALIDKFLAEGK
jgi:hypothetical protein